MGELVVVHIKTFIPTFQCMSFHQFWIWIDIGTFYVNFWNSSHLPIQHILEVNLKFESDEKSKFYTATQVVLPIRCVLHVFFIIIFFMSEMCAIVTFIFLNFLSMTWWTLSGIIFLCSVTCIFTFTLFMSCHIAVFNHVTEFLSFPSSVHFQHFLFSTVFC